jgi:hypothetical protein
MNTLLKLVLSEFSPTILFWPKLDTIIYYKKISLGSKILVYRGIERKNDLY